MYRRGANAILVVDDDAGVRSLLKNALEEVGYHVDSATYGNEAFSLWESGEYGLIVTDVMYKGEGGIDFVARIRNMDDDIPILVITGYGREVAQEALDAGADHILMKPFHLFQIRDMVAKLVP
jgi:two-component system response regulator AtoC